MIRLSMERLKQTRKHVPGEACGCANCRGSLYVYASRTVGGIKTQYLECNTCDWKPEDNKIVSRVDELGRKIPDPY
jgi:hypothetical protein